jgi:hypothetical protein
MVVLVIMKIFMLRFLVSKKVLPPNKMDTQKHKVAWIYNSKPIGC